MWVRHNPGHEVGLEMVQAGKSPIGHGMATTAHLALAYELIATQMLTEMQQTDMLALSSHLVIPCPARPIHCKD